MKVLVTGAAGFIGSHLVEHHAKKGREVVALDNLSRGQFIGRSTTFTHNWEYLREVPGVTLIRGDVRNREDLIRVFEDVDIVFHAAAQTAATTSVHDPRTDFEVNAVGTFNVLDAARQSTRKPSVIFCSSNKVYGSRLNELDLAERETRYEFGAAFRNGVPETFGVDLCKHSPYGCSKLVGDLYAQEYGLLYGLKVGIFRMSSIYGTRQFGAEDQGWVAWLAISTILGKRLTIDGNGKQVRDILHVSDLMAAFDAFLDSDLPHGLFNMGGGPDSALSLLEMQDLLEDMTGARSPVVFRDWRPGDQKVYVSDISKAKSQLRWLPKVSPGQGVSQVVEWIRANENTIRQYVSGLSA